MGLSGHVHKQALWLLGGLLVTLSLTVVLYWPGLGGRFFLDDVGNITGIAYEGRTWRGLVDAALGNTSGPLGRPVTVATFVANLVASGPDPWAFKYTNLMLHLITGLSLFWLGGRLLCTQLGPLQTRRAWAIAALAAFVWLIHPLQVSTVLYAVQRMAQLSFLFTVLALLSYCIGRERLCSGRRGAYTLMSLGLGMFGLLAVFSKENGALIPLFLILLELIVFRFRVHRPAQHRFFMAFFVAIALVPVGLGLLYALTHADALTAAYIRRPFDLTERLMTESRVMFFYLRLILVPTLGELNLFQDDFPISRTFGVTEAGAILGLAALAWIVIRYRRTAPVLSLGIGWFLLSHTLESTFLPLELVFEHRNYGASYGLILVLAYYLPQAWTELRSLVNAQRAFLVLYVTTLAFLTHARAAEWGDFDKMLLLAEEDRPRSARVQTELGNRALGLGDYALGRKHLLTAKSLEPKDTGIGLHLLYSYCYDSQPDAQTLANIVLDLEHNIITPYAVTNLSKLIDLVGSGNCEWREPEALLELVDAALRNPDLTRQKLHHALMYLLKGRVQNQLRDFTGALTSFDNSIRIAPEDGRALLDKAVLQMYLYDTDGARTSLQQLSKLSQKGLKGQHHKIERAAELLKLIERETEQYANKMLADVVDNCRSGSGGDNSTLSPVIASIKEQQPVNHLVFVGARLMSSYIDERCPGLDPMELAALGETLAGHPNFGADSAISYEFLLYLARLYSRMDRPQAAIAQYTRASKVLSDAFAAPFEKAYLQLNTGDVDGAAKTVAVLRDGKYSSFKNFSTEIDELEMLVKSLRDAPHV